jgi:uncharacterized protein YndB with AHSA1/START domain
MTASFDPHPLADLIEDGVVDARWLPHPPERVWRALTDSRELSAWLAPASLVPEVGGTFRLDLGAGLGAERVASGAVVTLDAPHVLELTWNEEGAENDSVVRFEIEPHPKGCLLTLGHHRIPRAAVPGYGAAWHGSLDALGGHLATTDEPDRPRDLHRFYDAAMAETAGDQRRRVRMERVLPAAPDRVWQALCDPEARALWLGARGQLEPVVGSAVDLVFGSEDRTTGTVLAVDPGRSIAFTWQSADAPESEVRFTVEPHPRGSLLVLTHLIAQGVPHRMAAGWRCHLRELRQLLDGETPWWDAAWFDSGLRAYATPNVLC